MTVVASTPRNPENIDAPVGGTYATGTSNFPGGKLTINDVMPWPGRTGNFTSVSAKAQQESIARMYGSSRTAPAAEAN